MRAPSASGSRRARWRGGRANAAAAAKRASPRKRAAAPEALAAKARESSASPRAKRSRPWRTPADDARDGVARASRGVRARRGGLFSAAPAVQYLSHKATPSWRASR